MDVKFDKAIEELRLFSIKLNKAFSDQKELVNQLNALSKESKYKLFESYESAEGPVKGIRRQVSKILNERDIDFEELKSIIDSAISRSPKSFSRMYRNWYNMLYMFLIQDFKTQMNESIDYISNDLLIKLDKNDQLTSVKFDFTGERETGSTRVWIAIFNNSHEKQTTAKQLFINIEKGEMEYCLYDRPKDKKYGLVHLNQNEPLNSEKLLRVFQEQLPNILNDDAGSLIAINPETGKKDDDQINIDTEKDDLNIILYGPPGTGKTFRSKEFAIRAIENLNEVEFKDKYGNERDVVNKQYNLYNERNQIAFVTFHQSFSYEDFMEGIKPKLINEKTNVSEDTEKIDKSNQGSVEYEIKDGVFKTIAETAKNYQSFLSQDKSSLWKSKIKPDEYKGKRFFKMSLGNTALEEYDLIYKYCINNNCIALGYGDGIDFTNAKSRQEIIDKYKEAGIILKGKQDFNVFAIERFKLWMKKGDIVLVSYGNLLLKAIGIITGDYIYNENSEIPFDHFRKVEWLLVDQKIPVNEVYEKSFSQQTIYELWDNKIKKDFFLDNKSSKDMEQSKRNHVIIIDEINRGNIASIFGELITLIEVDKRDAGKEAITAFLPYSKKSFSVPSNLYIIGTMNTADRSIESLDTALRRRFSFVEIAPDPTLMKYEKNNGHLDDIDLIQMLEVINERIEKLIDKEHKIGHSYFLKLKTKEELTNLFYDRIIPLLEEYFFGDLGKIGLVLGDSFIVTKPKNNTPFAKFTYEESVLRDLKDKKVYEIKDKKFWDFKNIYELN